MSNQNGPKWIIKVPNALTAEQCSADLITGLNAIGVSDPAKIPLPIFQERGDAVM